MEYKLNKSQDLYAEIFIDGRNLFERSPQCREKYERHYSKKASPNLWASHSQFDNVRVFIEGRVSSSTWLESFFDEVGRSIIVVL